MQDSIIKNKSYCFALQIIELCSELKDFKHYVISTQLLRAGTSIGANVEEALAGQSRKDFFAKISIASKESREANYWLRLIRDSNITSDRKIDVLIKDSEELIKILTAIVKTGNRMTQNSKYNNLKLKT